VYRVSPDDLGLGSYKARLTRQPSPHISACGACIGSSRVSSGGCSRRGNAEKPSLMVLKVDAYNFFSFCEIQSVCKWYFVAYRPQNRIWQWKWSLRMGPCPWTVLEEVAALQYMMMQSDPNLSRKFSGAGITSPCLYLTSVKFPLIDRTEGTRVQAELAHFPAVHLWT
jgi:hypothetical protein